MKQNISFCAPVHHTPDLIAYSYTYQPYVSIKLDGLFHKVDNNNKINYYPIFPHDWIYIEGEYYEIDKDHILLYVFFIRTKSDNIKNLEEMSNIIDRQFMSLTNFNINETYNKNNKDKLENILFNNFNKSVEWSDLNKSNKKIVWFPKKYCKINIISWNNYIDTLCNIFNFFEKSRIKKIIKHDGIIITPKYIKLINSIIKIKPKDEMTIDLLFNGTTFVSREGTSYSDIIIEKDISKYEVNSTYRLGPNKKNQFIVYAKREAWKKPNFDKSIINILYITYNYFKLKQLKDLYMSPWYGETNRTALHQVVPLFQYSQHIYNTIISKLNYGYILDIGCGSMGQYYKILDNSKVIQYIGFDIDLVKLYEAQYKTYFDEKYKFVLFNYGYSWDKQNKFFPNNIWKTYYKNLVNYNIIFDNIFSIFSAQYANETNKSWNHFIEEINKRTKSGSKFFIMWVDLDKIETNSSYYELIDNKKQVIIKLPHREKHIEPTLSYTTIIKSLKDEWNINNKLSYVNILNINKALPIYDYIKIINWLVLEKK